MNTTQSQFDAQQTQFQQQANTSKYNFEGVKQNPPPTGYAQLQSRRGPGPTRSGPTGADRPMTSIKAVVRNPQSQEQKQVKIDKVPDQSPESNFKQQEKEINQLLEASALAKIKGNLSEALEKAKDAVNKEKLLRRQKENMNQADSINIELSFTVAYNLANQLQANGIYQEALQKYSDIIKSKIYPQAYKLRVNMGNIYFQQEKYSAAIKMYKMVYDWLPPTSKEMRFQVLKNIGHAYVKEGKFDDAINTYETIMKGNPDFQTAFNLLLCLYDQGDKLRMKDCFSSMLGIEIPGYTENEEEEMNQESAFNDPLREEIKEKKRIAIDILVKSAKLIAPVIEEDIIDGYDWIIETLKESYFPEVQAEVEICKAMAYLKSKNMDKSIETLKSFERKDKIMMGRVATNISFLYFLENDFKNAEKYADVAINYDRFNPKALVNRGNCLLVKNEFLRSKEQYLEAIGVEADCIEALYNLAFVNKKLNMFNEALQALEKLQTIISTPEVVYQMASIHELMGQTKQALKWYQVLLTKVPTDPNILARVGNIFAREDDETQALHYYSESYKYLPTNIETIGWLGIYYVKQEYYERACHFFERASQIQPKEIKWRLMVASCYRRMGSYQKALKIYEEIYQDEPRNVECLKFLTQLCKEMGLPYEQYASELRKLEAEEYAVNYQIEPQGGYDPNNGGYDPYGTGQSGNQEIDITSQTRRGVVARPQQQVQQQIQNEDDWGADDLGDGLMPV
ncbi:tetratricopeptide repeat protein (macronuclear) [Tetrahymena thermophila SB210]|uniref:Tetratricopeptide repeat protein n=1 Tax=Tetrahymena thermophila (strain SB210) TaxID=312017 RepID=Q22AX6_TETTS|nr:tetratricopeptide repeat protein [Tetrahymena thermophila SB210]EAR82438.2 tetratricopeptide repeat protein [Tetrahymena thermophila SB210]|eukprot:XP_001030101.2 tetratricopeptide repeat protein [Tetrahymena thermophila SB210]